MPAAHSVLWCLGVFVGLWGLTLVVRGTPRAGLRRMPGLLFNRAGAEGVEKPGDWRLVIGGIAAIFAGCGAFIAGIAVHEWVHGPGADFALAFWTSAAMGVGAFSLSVLVWAVRGQITRVPRCPVCLYDMAGSGSLCPECGFVGKEPADFLKPRRRKRTAMAAAVMLLLSPSLMLMPTYRKQGPIGLVPSVVLIAGYEWLPESWIYYGARPDRGTLEERYWDEGLQEWQFRWLERRAVRLATSARSGPRTAMRAMRLCSDHIYETKPQAALERLVELLERPTGASMPVWTLPGLTRSADANRAIIERNAERLAVLLQDANSDVVCAAAALLIVLPERRAEVVEALSVSIMNNPASHYQARFALRGAIGIEDVRQQLIEMLSDPRPEGAQIAVWALQRGELTEAEMESLRGLLNGLDPQAAVRAAEVIMARDESEKIRMILDSGARRPAEEAALLLVVLKNYSLHLLYHITALQEALSSEHVWVRTAALDLLEHLYADGRTLDGMAIEAIRGAAGKETDPELRGRAFELLESLARDGYTFEGESSDGGG
jgi:HEAT repeat protein